MRQALRAAAAVHPAPNHGTTSVFDHAQPGDNPVDVSGRDGLVVGQQQVIHGHQVSHRTFSTPVVQQGLASDLEFYWLSTLPTGHTTTTYHPKFVRASTETVDPTVPTGLTGCTAKGGTE